MRGAILMVLLCLCAALTVHFMRVVRHREAIASDPANHEPGWSFQVAAGEADDLPDANLERPAGDGEGRLATSLD